MDTESGHFKQKVVTNVAATDPGRIIKPMAGVGFRARI